MIITSRDYQIEAVQSVPRYFEKNKGNPLIAMPTGTGKSVVIAMLLQYVFQWPGQKVIIATHVKELIQQNYNKLMAVWPNAPAGIYSAGLGQKEHRFPITFAGIASVAKVPGIFGKVDLLLIDEAHLVSPKDETNYRRFIDQLLKVNPFLKVIGFTATPWRLGFGSLVGDSSIFTDFCFNITTLEAFNRLISEGYLSMLVSKNPSMVIDTSQIKMQGGEFNQHDLQLAVDKKEISERALREAIHYSTGRNKWAVYCAGVEHAIHCAEILTSLGVPCKAVHSKMDNKNERDSIIEEWIHGDLRAVTNNNILTTGIDHPMLDYIIMLRPTASSNLWVQMLGRGTRPVYADGFDLSTIDGRLDAIQNGPKQNCLVMDFAGNTKRLGPINDPVIPNRKGKKGPGEAPVKLCSCGTWNHARASFCVACGAKFEIQTKFKETADTTPIMKLDIPETREFHVDSITYSSHLSKRMTTSLRVTYYCGMQSVVDYVPVEDPSGARGIAVRWWNERARLNKGMVRDLPRTVAEILDSHIETIPPATDVRVWTNARPVPKIIAYCFDGTNFNKQAPSTKVIPVKRVDEINPWARKKISTPAPKYNETDDEFPF